MIIVAIVIVLGLLALLVTVLYSWQDSNIEVDLATTLHQLLPNEDCGLCGYDSCHNYVRAIIEKTESNAKKCRLQTAVEKDGLIRNLKQLDSIVPYDEQHRAVAVVLCQGGTNIAKERLNYRGHHSCMAVKETATNFKKCLTGCIGFGDCETVCPVHAINMVKGVAVVNREKCTGCAICLKSCPLALIKLVSRDLNYIVACSSHDLGAETAESCRKGCTACHDCVKNAPLGAFSVKNNLAQVDFLTKEGEERWRAAVACETQSIIPLTKAEKENYLAHQKSEKEAT